MKFTSTVLTLGLAMSTIATQPLEGRYRTLVERDMTSITSVLDAIQSGVQSLDSTIQAYTGGSPTAIQSASDALVAAINAGVTTVKASSSLSEQDALSLSGPGQTLNEGIKTTISDLIAKKSQIVAAGQGAAVLASLQSQKTASSALSDVVTSKVPTTLQPIAAQLTSGVAAEVQKGIDAYQDTGAVSSSPEASSQSMSVTSSASTSITSTPRTSSAVASSTSCDTSSSAATNSSSSAASGTGFYTSTKSASAPQYTGAAVVNSLTGQVGAIIAFAALLGM